LRFHYLTPFFSASRRHITSTPFPYTTLFRSPFCRTNQSRATLNVASSRAVTVATPLREAATGPRLTVTIEHARRSIASSAGVEVDRKSTRLNSSHGSISYAVFCLKQKNRRES